MTLQPRQPLLSLSSILFTNLVTSTPNNNLRMYSLITNMHTPYNNLRMYSLFTHLITISPHNSLRLCNLNEDGILDREGHMVNPNTVMFMVQQLPKEAPGQMVCPGCRHTVLSIIKYKRGVLSWTLCGVLFAFLCWPCFWIPLVADACKDVEHSCPICKTILHVYKRR
ncbi:lipopolysaccharide-induced tumor necrosis factor-alpha factor homolog isoform X10 [Paralichthys olivaceus]|uniref:lipopolysaccharide-induced tumor necrosis factor-alpha factor homolog isoform X10 n=1 Tax=Paralichthys olivaceus TaxID=8255 RepID=UPI003753CEBA